MIPQEPYAFLAHASEDKQAVRELRSRLKNSGFTTWLDEVDLLPGEDWREQIERAVQSAEFVVVCLSRNAVEKRGFLQKEIRMALDAADECPEGKIYFIPTLLEDCEVPARLHKWQHVKLYEPNGFERLIVSLCSIDIPRGAQIDTSIGSSASLRSAISSLNDLIDDAQGFRSSERLLSLCVETRLFWSRIHAASLHSGIPVNLHNPIRDLLDRLSAQEYSTKKSQQDHKYIQSITRRVSAIDCVLDGKLDRADDVLYGFCDSSRKPRKHPTTSKASVKRPIRYRKPR